MLFYSMTFSILIYVFRNSEALLTQMSFFFSQNLSYQIKGRNDDTYTEIGNRDRELGAQGNLTLDHPN